MCFSDWINLLSAIGTVGATIVALWLALSERQQHIDCAFMWETATNDKPTLIINNIGKHTVIIESVKVYFRKKHIGSFDILRHSELSQYAIISPNKEVRIMLDTKFLNVDNAVQKDPDKIYRLTAVVQTTNGKRYKSSYKYSYNDLQGLLFAAAFD